MFNHRELLQYFIILQFETSPMTLFLCKIRPEIFRAIAQHEKRCRFLVTSIVPQASPRLLSSQSKADGLSGPQHICINTLHDPAWVITHGLVKVDRQGTSRQDFSWVPRTISMMIVMIKGCTVMYNTCDMTIVQYIDVIQYRQSPGRQSPGPPGQHRRYHVLPHCARHQNCNLS